MTTQWEDNPNYDPEKCGLEIVYVHNFSNESCQFDFRVIWRNLETGLFYTARDSGCSCPTPFEDIHSLDDLTEVRSFNWLIREAKEEALGTEYRNYDGDPIVPYIDELHKLELCLTKI